MSRKIFKDKQDQINKIKDIYDNATDTIRTNLSDFRQHVINVLHCSRSVAYNSIKAFKEEYHVEFVIGKGKGLFARTPEYKAKLSKAMLGKTHTADTRARISKAVTARQLGTTYTMTANGKRLGKKSLHDENEQFEMPNLSTRISIHKQNKFIII